MQTIIRRFFALSAVLMLVGCATPSDSTVGRFNYDADAELLTVRFDKGGVYQYEDVPADVYQQIEASDSKGAAFNDLVKSKFKSTKVSD
jgi:hypothetical protein